MAQKKLFFATTNQGKLTEAQALFKETGCKLLSLADFPKLKSVVIEETGSTFSENAYLKAKAYGELSQTMTVAEDAGLEVFALDRKPGVRSARFGPTAEERNEKLLKLLADKTDRSAQFVSVLALYDPASGSISFFKGTVKGKIATEARGKGGFGYDPVFVPEGYEKTFAELGLEVKNKFSHRQRAFQQLLSDVIIRR